MADAGDFGRAEFFTGGSGVRWEVRAEGGCDGASNGRDVVAAVFKPPSIFGATSMARCRAPQEIQMQLRRRTAEVLTPEQAGAQRAAPPTDPQLSARILACRRAVKIPGAQPRVPAADRAAPRSRAEAIQTARGVRFKKRIVLGVRGLALGCILLVGK